MLDYMTLNCSAAMASFVLLEVNKHISGCKLCVNCQLSLLLLSQCLCIASACGSPFPIRARLLFSLPSVQLVF